jgi:pectate lyase
LTLLPHRSVSTCTSNLLRGALLLLAAAVPAAAYSAADSTGGDTPTANASADLAFPGAVGWAAHTPGGRGGKIIRVTTLAGSGPGSFAEAINTKGPRIVVFEVGGIIDLGKKEIVFREPNITVAGQTAPSPGITLIRGGIDVATHDVIIQHIRVRPGEAGAQKMSGWEVDALSTVGGAHDVIVDHCSFTWATDENLSASGPRFNGKTPDEWREATSHRITYSNNIIAEGLANSTHSKGEHSKGSLIHDNVTDILIINNLYAHNMERNPLFKGGARGVVANNLIYDPGQKATHYNLIAEEWQDEPRQVGSMAFIGNVMRAGPSTPTDLAFFALGGSGDMEYYAADNIAVDRLGRPIPMTSRYTTSAATLKEVKRAPVVPGWSPMRAADVQDSVIKNVGARPWDRDHTDSRILADTIEGRGKIIDSEAEVGGYPTQVPTTQHFDESQWDLRFMTRR